MRRSSSPTRGFPGTISGWPDDDVRAACVMPANLTPGSHNWSFVLHLGASWSPGLLFVSAPSVEAAQVPLAPVPVAPDEAVEGHYLWYVPQPRHERQGEEQDGGGACQVDRDQVYVGRIVKTRDLVPKGVQPEPGLAWVAARFVHDAPLVAFEVLGACLLSEELAVF